MNNNGSKTRKITDYYKIQKNEILGQGQFGEIYLCEKINDDQQDKKYCVKRINITQNYKNQEERISGVLSDYTKSNPQFINIVQTYDTFKDDNFLYIVMERCDENLFSEFEKMNQENSWYTEQQVFEIIRQIITTWKELYNLNIIHRDIKPENILIKKEIINGTQKKIYKIGDFGVGKIAEDSLSNSIITNTGTLIYAAPQMIFNEQCTAKCDIFSYGFLFYQICYNGNEPYDCYPKYNLIKSLQQIKVQPFKCPPLKYSRADVLQDLIEKMLVFEENNRASFEYIFNHPVMTVRGIEDTAIMNESERNIFPSVRLEGFQNKKELKDVIQFLQMYQSFLELFYNRFKICIYVLNQMENNEQYYVLSLIIHLIAKQQLNYALAMIYIIPQDFHPEIIKQNELTDLIEKLQKVFKDLNNFKNVKIVNEFLNYQKEIQITFHKFNVKLSNLSNKITLLNLKLENEQIRVFCDSNFCRVEILTLQNMLKHQKNKLTSSIENNLMEFMNQIVDLDQYYSINLCKSSIDINKKFPKQIIQQYEIDFA